MKVYLLARNWGDAGYAVVDIYTSAELATIRAKEMMYERDVAGWKELEFDNRFVKRWKNKYDPIVEIEEREVIES